MNFGGNNNRIGRRDEAVLHNRMTNFSERHFGGKGLAMGDLRFGRCVSIKDVDYRVRDVSDDQRQARRSHTLDTSTTMQQCSNVSLNGAYTDKLVAHEVRIM